MKKIILILFLMLVLVPSCKRKAIQELNQQNRELTRLAAERDSILNQLSSSFDQFESTLGVENNNNGDLKERIENSIEHLKGLLEENERKQRALRRTIASSRVEKEKVQSRIDSLSESINQKNDQIVALNNDIANLKTQIDTQEVRINTLTELNTNQNNKIENMNTELNTAHLVVGDSKELLEKDVIVKKGGFLGLFGRVEKLNPKFNPDEFKKVDILTDTQIELPDDKVNIVTVHPSGSYNLVDTNNMKVLEILDPEKFWEASRYLVVVNQ